MKRKRRPNKKKRQNRIFFLLIMIIVLSLGVILIGIYIIGSGGKNNSGIVSDLPSDTPEPTKEMSSSQISVSVSASSSVPTSAPTLAPASASSSSRSLSEGPVSTIRTGWAYTPSGIQGVPARNSAERIELCDKYDGIWQGDKNFKVVYITMDVGYEYNNNTTKILDIAKEKNVKINFFITGTLFKTEALRNLVLRMYMEGHLVANHTWNHLSMPILYNENGEKEVKAELDKVAGAFFDVTGHEMPRFMRPPMGEYSAATMKLTNEMGYKTVFWSFAYRDWETDKQPDPGTALASMMLNLHNGTVFLIHAVSDTNVSILPELIDNIRDKGYEIALLSDFK